MPSSLIRRVAAADIDAIAAIYRDEVLTGTASYELIPPDAAEMRGRVEGLVGQGYPYLVIETGGAVAGFAYAGPFRARPAYAWMAETSIYLAPAARGRGEGTRLLSRLVETCEAGGFRQMLAVIGGADNLGSIRLHARAGFRQTGVIAASGYKFGRWIDTVLMQRSVGPGATDAPDPAAPPVPRRP